MAKLWLCPNVYTDLIVLRILRVLLFQHSGHIRAIQGIDQRVCCFSYLLIGGRMHPNLDPFPAYQKCRGSWRDEFPSSRLQCRENAVRYGKRLTHLPESGDVVLLASKRAYFLYDGSNLFV